jgi:hypothetical protein
MISLGTHQASTWGYSTRPLTPTFTGPAVGSTAFVGLFTKTTLAPNGNMYAILGAAALSISGVSQQFVILKIVPGTTNTATTNYAAPSYSFLIADNGFAANGNGFAKPSWGAIAGTNADNSAFRFNTGILASNGLIYFPPVQCGTNNNYWVIFDPTTDLWKVTNALRPSTLVGDLTNLIIGGAVLGTDNRIYVYSMYGRGFRITTSTNASNDTVQDSYYTGGIAAIATPTGNDTAPLSWRDEAGAVYTDVASLLGTTKAYDNASTSQNSNVVRIFTTVSDAIVHPTGRIYLMPGLGRGRIFYINQSAYGTTGELVSAPGLSTASIAGYGQKSIGIYSAVLEKPRDANHDPATLKIFLIPAVQYVTNANVCTDILVINPQSQTMSALSMQYINRAPTDPVGFTALGKLINLPNGMSLTYNRITTSGSDRHGGMILSGSDVPASDTDGLRTIPIPNKGIMQDQDIQYLGVTNPSVTGIGGGTNGLWPHNGKFIGIFNPSFSLNWFFYEIVSVKGYHPGVTNFNFSARDRLFYSIPSNLNNLGSTVYNCQFNKPR